MLTWPDDAAKYLSTAAAFGDRCGSSRLIRQGLDGFLLSDQFLAASEDVAQQTLGANAVDDEMISW